MTSQIGLLNAVCGVESGKKLDFRTKHVSPAIGVKSDLEKLLTRFTETNSVRYEEFAELWRDMKMTMIFAGRQTEAECREFLEDSFRIAVQFLLPPYNFQVRVGALYILYALYLKQPCVPVVKIRLLPGEFSELPLFLEEVQKQNHLDVEYIYHFLCYHRAFTLVATALPMFPMTRGEGGGGEDPQLVARQDILLEQKSILSEIMEPDNIDQLSAIHEQYHRTKCLLSGGRTQPKTSLNVIKASLVQYITKMVAANEEKRKHIIGKKSRRRHDSGQTTTSESEAESDIDAGTTDRQKRSAHTERQKRPQRGSSTEVGQRRAAIKARAFSGVQRASKSRRHRQAVTESSQDDSFTLDSPIRSPAARRRKQAAAAATEQPEDEEDLSQLNEQLKQSLLSMPCLTELTDIPPLKQKRKSTGGTRKGKQTVQGKKQKRTGTKSKNAATSKSVGAVKEEECSGEEVGGTREAGSKRGRSAGRKTSKKMPKIQMKEKKAVKVKGKKTKQSSKKGAKAKQTVSLPTDTRDPV